MEQALASSTDFLTPLEVAHRLAVGERSVRRWIAEGQLPIVRFGRSVRVPMYQYKAFVAQRSSAA
jgi:excisionase family DNA binding protein